MAAGIYHWSFFFLFCDTCLLIKSMACALSCSALCKSARMRVSATFSTERLLHKASSHITFKRSRAYWGGGDGTRGGTQRAAIIVYTLNKCRWLTVLSQLVQMHIKATDATIYWNGWLSNPNRNGEKMTRIQNAEAEGSLISILKKTKSTTLQFYASVDQ